MKIRELLDTLKRPVRTEDSYKYGCYDVPEDFFTHLDLEDLCFSSNSMQALSKAGLYSVEIANWLCTDTNVGWNVIFLNNKPLVITFKPARKSDSHFFWIVPKNEVIKMLMEICPKTSNDHNNEERIYLDDDMSVIGLESDYGIRINYTTQVMGETVIYQGKHVSVVRPQLFRCGKTTLKILVNGKEKIVPISEILIPLNTKQK